VFAHFLCSGHRRAPCGTGRSRGASTLPVFSAETGRHSGCTIKCLRVARHLAADGVRSLQRPYSAEDARVATSATRGRRRPENGIRARIEPSSTRVTCYRTNRTSKGLARPARVRSRMPRDGWPQPRTGRSRTVSGGSAPMPGPRQP